MDVRPRIIGSKLVHDGYIYTRSKMGDNLKNYWDCQNLRKKLCTAQKVTEGEGDHVRVTKSSPHTHAPDRELAEAEVVKYNLKEEQKKDPEKIPSAILRKVLPRTSSGVIEIYENGA